MRSVLYSHTILQYIFFYFNLSALRWISSTESYWKVCTLCLFKRVRWINLFTKYLLIASIQAHPLEVAILSYPMEVSRGCLSLPSQQEFSPLRAELSLLSCPWHLHIVTFIQFWFASTAIPAHFFWSQTHRPKHNAVHCRRRCISTPKSGKLGRKGPQQSPSFSFCWGKFCVQPGH